MEIRRRSWPADPARAVEILRVDLPACWKVTYAPGLYRASRQLPEMREAVESSDPGEVVALIDALFDEDSR